MRPLLEFLKRFDYVFLFILLQILAVVMIAKNSYYQSSRILGFTNSIAGKWYTGVSSVTDYFGLKKENDAWQKRMPPSVLSLPPPISAIPTVSSP